MKLKLLAHLLKDDPGRRVKSPEGRIYTTTRTGTTWRIHPERPWRGKTERRQKLRPRRLARNGHTAALENAIRSQLNNSNHQH